MGDDSELVGYLVVKVKGSDPDGEPEMLDIFGNEQFYLGRNESLCRHHWSDPTISNRHIRIHCILYEKDRVSEIPPFVYATDVSTNGTFIKKKNTECVSSQSGEGILMGRGNGSFLLDDGDELRISDTITLEYHELEEATHHKLTFTQEREKQLFASRYLVTGRLLGKGGYGKVLVGIDQQSQRQLACKVVNLRGLYDRSTAPNLRSPDVPKSLATSARDRWPSKVVRCFREFEVLKDVSHPNIISIEKVFWNSNTIYIFEELVTGGDLFSYIEYKQGCLTDVEAAVIVRQVLIGIEYLHNLGIVHRDLKPDNVLMSSLEDGARIVITDFGNARHLPSANPTSFSRSSSRRRMHSLVGTFEYAAPEIHCRNPMIPAKHGYCKAVDMWSIGSITSALLSGDVIFTDRAHPDYYEKPFEVIMRLAARCDTSIIDDPTDTAWSKVGDEPKDFVKKLLVLREEDRLTATEALAHPWFSNRRHAPEFKALYDRAIKDWRPPRNPEDLVETILDISPAAVQQRTKLSEHFAPASLQQSLRPSSSSRQTRLSPVAEVHEEDRFEDPNAYQYQSYDQQSYNQQFNDIDIKDPDCAQPGTHLHRPDSFDDSMQQLSVDSDPPASGMYPAHVPDARYFYDYGLSQVEVENSQQGEDPLSPTPETQTESLLVCETPPTRAGAKCPASSQEMINCESPIKVGTKRQLSSQNMIVCERPTKRGTKRPPSAEGMLPLYETLFGGNSAATGYVVQKKKKKLCYGKKPNSDYC